MSILRWIPGTEENRQRRQDEKETLAELKQASLDLQEQTRRLKAAAQR